MTNLYQVTTGRRLTWSEHIKTKSKAQHLKLRIMYWLFGRKSQLPLYNKLVIDTFNMVDFFIAKYGNSDQIKLLAESVCVEHP